MPRHHHPDFEPLQTTHQTIVDVQAKLIGAEGWDSGFRHLLDGFLSLTESQYGFIGEVLANPQGQATFQGLANRKAVLKGESAPPFQAQASPLSSCNLTLLMAYVIGTREVVMASNPRVDPHRGCLVHGELPIHAFLGIPFFQRDHLIGIVGLLNPPNGYDLDLLSSLEPFTKHCELSLHAYLRHREHRQKAFPPQWIKPEAPGISDRYTSVIDLKNLEVRYQILNRAYATLLHVNRKDIKELTEYGTLPFNPGPPCRENHSPVFSDPTPQILDGNVAHLNDSLISRSKRYPPHDETVPSGARRGMSPDITWRIPMSPVTRGSDEGFRIIANFLPVLIWIADAHHHRTYVNQGWLAFTGRSVEEELGRGWFQGVHPEDYDRCSRQYASAVVMPSSFELEYRIKHSSGEYRWVLDRGIPRFHQDGTFAGYMGTCIDISHRKALESSIQEYNHALKKEIQEQTVHIRELEKRQMQVEKRAALSQVAAGVAHEINNPLAGIKQSFQLVKKLLPSDHPRLKYARKIDEEINRIAEIIQKMYQLYQPRHVSPELLDLGQAGSKALDCIQALYPHTQIQVRRQFHDQLFLLPLPPTEIHQVLCNLIQNAFEALGTQGRIVMSTGRNSRSVWIRIADNGPGIPAELIPHIFDPFFSTKCEGGPSGLGLGLSVSKSLVEGMGGLLEVETTTGVGTTFSVMFELPMVPNYPKDERGKSVRESALCLKQKKRTVVNR